MSALELEEDSNRMKAVRLCYWSWTKRALLIKGRKSDDSLRDWSFLWRRFQNQRTNDTDVLVYRKHFWILVRRLNVPITTMTNKHRITTFDLNMKHFAWFDWSRTEFKCTVSFVKRKVLFSFKVINNPSFAKISQNLVNPNFETPTDFLRHWICH